MNFASNKKKRLFYQKRAFELSKKKRKTSPSTKSQQKISDRFNFFIDILNTNKKEQETKNKISKKVGVSENKENNPKNIDDIFNELKAIHKNTENDIITLEDINNSLLEDIENTITSNNNDNSNNSKLSNETIVSNLPKEERISNNEIKRDKYITRRKILTLKEHKIIQHNIDLILNKENDSAPNKINKKEIDIVNQFQLNALGYINFYAKKRKELIHQNKTNSEHQNIHNLDEEELERLIDQEWITLEKRIKNKHIEDVVRKQTKIAKKNLKNKKTNKNSGTDNSFQTIIENENENENEISSNQQLTKNIPIIPDSELIMTELKEYTELNLLNEMYNHSKQLSIPYFSVIKHPPNPFSIYTKDTINTVIKQNPSKTRNEALKIVAKNWKNENKDKKKKYEEKAKEYKDDYEDLIKYAYLQRALIHNPSIAKLCLENQLRNKSENEIDQDQIEKDIDFKELHNDNDIVKAFNYIVRRFPKGYPLASPVLRFPERSINKSKKIQNAKNNEIDNEHNSVKSDKLNTIIKPKVQAFEYFVKDRYEILFKSTPSIGLSDLFDELEKEWKNLSYEDKLPYILLEIKDVKRYYMDQCKISKERRGKKRKITMELLENELKNNQDISQNDVDKGNNIIVINSNDNNNKNNIDDDNNNNNSNTDGGDDDSNDSQVQSSQKIILKPKRIRRIKKKTQIQSQESSQQEKNENATLIVDSEGEQENDNNIISLKKNKSTSAQVNNNENIMGKNYDIESRNNTTLINNLDEMDDKYIDSDTSEEYLAFDDISRKFLFENYSENENSENKNEYNFDIQKIGLNKNKNKEKNETFIPVTNVDSNSPIKFSFSQDTIVYNSQNELNELSSNNFNENNSTLSNNEEIAGQMKNEKIIKSTPELIIDSNIDKSQSSVSPTIIQIPPTVIESSMKIATPLSSKFSSITNNDNNDKNNSSNNLETPKNSQSSKSLLKSLKPIRKSSSWRFGNDIDIIQRVSEEKVSFISNKSKDDESDEFDINNNSSSSSSSSSEEEEEEEIEENNENNIFLSKDKVSSNDKLSNNIKDNGNQASTPSNWNNKTTNTFNKLVFENSYVTPKKSGGKYKISYSSNKKKNNYYGIERRKYDLF